MTQLNEVGDVLKERAQTHGDFSENAYISQELKKIIGKNSRFTDVQAEVVDMICLKLSRIACNPNVKDHWTDIAGYATLAANRLTS